MYTYIYTYIYIYLYLISMYHNHSLKVSVPQAESRFVPRRFLRIVFGAAGGSLCAALTFGKGELDLAGAAAMVPGRVGAS